MTDWHWIGFHQLDVVFARVYTCKVVSEASKNKQQLLLQCSSQSSKKLSSSVIITLEVF
jgi:hypothetical protein